MQQWIRQTFDVRALLIATLASGTAFLLINLVFTPLLLGADADLVLRYFASLIMGEAVLLEDSTAMFVVGIIVNYIVALLATFVVTIVIHRWGLAVGIIGGAIMGLAIYSINLYTLTLFFDWFFAINSTLLLASHVVFGMVAGGVYELFDHYDTEFDIVKER